VNAAPMTEHPLARELMRVVQQAMGRALREAGQVERDGTEALTIASAPRATGPSALAAAHPGGAKARAQATIMYDRCLAHYRSDVQRKLRPSSNEDDVGLAAAYFVLVNLAAAENTDPDPGLLPALEHQLRHLIVSTGAWAATPLAQRQDLFEQLALLGVLINESRLLARSQGEAARANVRRAARGYVKQLLGLDPDLIVLTPQGLATADAMH